MTEKLRECIDCENRILDSHNLKHYNILKNLSISKSKNKNKKNKYKLITLECAFNFVKDNNDNGEEKKRFFVEGKEIKDLSETKLNNTVLGFVENMLNKSRFCPVEYKEHLLNEKKEV